LRIAERARRLVKGTPGDPQSRSDRPTRAVDLSWADEFIRNVRPYICVREEDNLLIKKPNQAHLLNPQGVSILSFLLEGGTTSQLLERVGHEPQRTADIALFLYEVRRCLDGTLQETNHTSAVEVRPLELNFSKLPVLSEVAVTSRCNLRCAFCYGSCSCTSHPANTKGEMTTEEIERVLYKIFHQAKVPSVSFTGGEPTMRPDLSRLISYAKGLGLRVNLITNGTLVTKGLARELAGAGLDSAQVSLEGANAVTHEAITGVPSSFASTVAAVRHLKDCGIPVHTNTTLNRSNLRDCMQMPRFAREELAIDKFSMNLVIPTGSALVNDELLIRYSEVGPIVEEILERSRRLGVEFMWYSPTPLCLFNPILHALGNKGCGACDGLLSVDCEGNVLPCSSCEDPVGNLLTSDFPEIWDSVRAQGYRLKRLAHPECRGCDSFPACHGACPLYWRHFGFDELCEHKGFGLADWRCVEQNIPSATGSQAV
jgi:radical SAM protein with 4Fe4S-binding SPASM domain